MTFRAQFVALLIATAVPVCVAAQQSPARPGDRILLRIVRDSVYTDTLRIDPEGMVVLPLAGDVRLGGIGGGSLQDTIRARLARFVAPSAVEATLLRRIRVVGEVAKPGVFYVDRTFTLRDAVAMAGGVNETGHERRLTLDRGGTQRVIPDWRTSVDGALAVESGDQLLVSRLPWYQRNALAVVTAVSVLASIIITLSR